jgi:serine/threonine-protein kinase
MIGETIGSYRVIREIGSGGMGVVYLAQHTVIGRMAAIKMLLPDLSGNEEMVNRMFNEARMCALIKHPGMVDVYDFGRHSNGCAYLVMELLEGESLHALVLREKILPPDVAVSLVRQIASAVGAAHAKGIIHRDLKPDNVFVEPDDETAVGLRTRVLDFGIAKLTMAASGNMYKTRTGALIGTPMYMSPEQCRGTGQIDPRTDIYSLGCIFFELVTGRGVFNHDGLGEVIAAHLYEPPASVRSLNPLVSPELDACIQRMLAKRPEDRFQTMDEVTAALGGRQALGRTPIPPTVALVATVATPLPQTVAAWHTPAPALYSTTNRTAGELLVSAPTRRRRTIFVVAGLASALAVAGGAAALFLGKPSHEGPAVTTAERRPDPAHAPAPVVVAPPPVAPPPTTPPPVHEPEPPPPSPAPVTLTVESDPSGADVFRADTGERIGATPVRWQHPRSSDKIGLVVRLAGHDEQKLEAAGDADAALRTTLAPTAKPVPPHKVPPPHLKKPPEHRTIDPFGDE